MATSVASPKSTGGGGFVFEDDACALWLACMLAGRPPFDVDLGPSTQLAFQTRPDGWLLDDVVATSESRTLRHRVAVSIKSNSQFSGAAAPQEFVRAVWEQWLHVPSQVFDRSSDVLALVTGPLPHTTRTALVDLVTKAVHADPATFAARVAEPGWTNEQERSLYASFACPQDLASSHKIVADETCRVLKRLRFAQYDFGQVGSEWTKNAIDFCRGALRSGDAVEADALWKELQALAAQLRPSAGTITREALVQRLLPTFSLLNHPDHRQDWATLTGHSNSAARQVPDAIAGNIRLARAGDLAALEGAIAAGDAIVLLGPSGRGKSVLARALHDRQLSAGVPGLWFDARSFERPDFASFEADLRLNTSMADLLRATPAAAPLLVLDGLDRLFDAHAFQLAASLIQLGRQPSGARWRCVVTCQSHEWPRVLDSLERAGLAGLSWDSVEAKRITTAELAPVTAAVPALKRLLLQPQIARLLTNLKMLDLVSRRLAAGATVAQATLVGETTVADWVWDAEIGRGPDGIARGKFVRALAQAQADLQVIAVPVDKLQVDLAPLAALTTDGICTSVQGDRISFAHDLYGDWARLRLLLNSANELPSFLATRLDSPLWHRAVRLYGVRILEGDGGVDRWRFALKQLTAARDLILEAPIFAPQPRPLLNAVLPDLLANKGELLRRVLTRFLAFATVPDRRMLAVARTQGWDETQIRANHRSPHWPYWLDVLAFLHEHRDAVVALASAEVSKIVGMWLEFARPGWVMRSEATELAVLLGHRAIATREVYGGGKWGETRQRFYRCLLAAARERTSDVIQIGRIAARRVPESEGEEGDASQPQPKVARRARQSRRPTPAPFPDGPLGRIDEAFQSVVLDGSSVRDLFEIQPAAARELILAALIEPPRAEDWSDSWHVGDKLDLHDPNEWLPALYTQGPFLTCLRVNFQEGLEVVAKLVDFATERWCHYADLQLRMKRARGPPRPEGQPASPPVNIERSLELSVDGANRRFRGGPRVYGWSAGFAHSPRAAEVALMALEQYFYIGLDQNEDVGPLVAAVLRRVNSVAFLKVLADVGKRAPILFEGPLRPLLTSPEIFEWEIAELVQGRQHMMIGAFTKGQWFIELAEKFHSLEHRKIDLRKLAIWLMHHRPAMEEFFKSVREEWARSAAIRGASEMMQQMSAALDPSSYEERDDPVHGRVLVNTKAIESQREHEDRRQENEDSLLLTMFPMSCRQLIDSGKEPPTEKLELLWKQWERVNELAREAAAEPDDEAEEEGVLAIPCRQRFANAIAGGAAVFLRSASWLASVAGRKEACVAALQALLSGPPSAGVFDHPSNAATWTWDCFAAEAAVALWVANPSDRELRRLVAGMVLLPHYAAVELLFTRAAAERRRLGADFERLRRLLFEWAHVRHRAELLKRGPGFDGPLTQPIVDRGLDAVQAWAEDRLRRFVDETLATLPDEWSECDDVERFAEVDAALDGRRRWSPIDLVLIRHAHRWLPQLHDAADEAERARCVQFWREAMKTILVRPQMEGTSERVHPYDDERWVLEGVGPALLSMRPAERPNEMLDAVFALPVEAHDWPEDLAQSVFRFALRTEKVPEQFPSIVRQMVRRALPAQGQKPDWHYFEEVWDAIIGVDSYTCILWEPRHQDVVTALTDVIEIWMARAPMYGRRLQRFADWLARPAARPVRVRAAVWLAEVVRGTKERKRIHDAEDAEDSIATLLDALWNADESAVRADPAAMAAFRSLLQWLSEQQNAVGLELLGRLGSLAAF